MISLSHRFIFIHVPKTAGTALAEALQPYARPEPRTLWRRLLRRLPVQQPPDKAYFRQHDTAAEIRATLTPEVFDRFHSFGVVRNPFDHAISYYEFMKEYRRRRHARLARSMSFREHLEYRLAPRPFYHKPFLRLPNQSYYLCDAAGRVLVSQVLHYERLAEELPALTDRLGLPPVVLPVARKSRFRKADRSIADYYGDPATVDLARRLYAPDFENFGYSRDPS
ncbi:sulfotransferase family 2 domain-containing protein [Albidovulum sp.]